MSDGKTDRFVSFVQFVMGIMGAVAITIVSAFAMFPTKEQMRTEMDLRASKRDEQFKSIDEKLNELRDGMKDLNNFIRARGSKI
jgi:uncharacterized protein YlxW (UPF0749 family)